MAQATYLSRVDQFAEYIKKPCTCTWDRESGTKIRLINWATLKGKTSFLQDLFGDCGAEDYPGLIAHRRGRVAWVSETMIPFAFVGEQLRDDDGQLDAVLMIDPAKEKSAVFAILVDGTAIPAQKPTRVASSLAALRIIALAPAPKKKAPLTKAARGGPSFEDHRKHIKSKKIDGNARKILQQLSGDRQSGSGYLDQQTEPPEPPEGRDPRWIDALQEELAKSMVWASSSYQSETYFFAGTLASFGLKAAPALVAALDAALEQYPRKSLAYGVEPFFQALVALRSDAGVPGALELIQRADNPEESQAIGPALDYLVQQSDMRIAPVIKELAAQPGVDEEVIFYDELEALADKLKIKIPD